MKLDAAAAQRIPGMIEPVEQELLFSLAQSLALAPGDCVIEFGTFFGRSTHCLAQGLASNPGFGGANRFAAYDSFRCARDGAFAPYVLQFAQQGEVSHLLQSDGASIDFQGVFTHYLQEYIERLSLQVVQSELADSQPPEGTIAMLHIDSPKFYAEFKAIAFRFLPRLRAGAVVVFQDFFYQWSASLVAITMLLVRSGILAIGGSAASSLVTRVQRAPTLQELAEFDLVLDRPAVLPGLVDEAIRLCGGLSLDRKEQFLPRLHLAKFQCLWEQGAYPDAARLVQEFFAAGHRLNQAVVNDFMEMLGKGFSVRRAYERDHHALASAAAH